MLKRLSIVALLLAALMIPLAACKVQVPEKLANALAKKISGGGSAKEGESASAQLPQKQSRTTGVVLGSFSVAANQSQSYRVVVTDDMEDARLVGSFRAAGGSGNDIIVYIMDPTAYENFSNGHQVSVYYNSGQVTTESFNVRLPGSGTYYLVYSNRFSTFSSKTVAARTDLVFMR
jgi:hypothetical protein